MVWMICWAIVEDFGWVDMLGKTIKVCCGPCMEGINPVLLILLVNTALGFWLCFRPMMMSIYDSWKTWINFLMSCYEDPSGIALGLVNIIEWMNIRLGMIKLLQSKGVRWHLKDAYPYK